MSKKEILALSEKVFKSIPCKWLDEWSNINGVDKLLSTSTLSDTIKYFFDWDYSQYMKFRDFMLAQGYIEKVHTRYYKLKERNR